MILANNIIVSLDIMGGVMQVETMTQPVKNKIARWNITRPA